MKADIHPQYRQVVFKDKTADFAILTRSSIKTTETIKWQDGKEYPVYYVDISSASHPFYTGKQQFVDTMGRVEKFRKKFGGQYQSTEKSPTQKKKAKK
jgi:large subunit ribosomal protein L31